MFLWFFVGPESSDVVLGFREAWLFLAFPVVGSTLAVFWAWVVASFGRGGEPDIPINFGGLKGSPIGLLSFISFCGLLAVYGSGFVAFLAFLMFGFLLVGWIILLLGALTERAIVANI